MSHILAFTSGFGILASVALAASTPPVECAHLLLGTDASIKQAQLRTAELLAMRGQVKEDAQTPWNGKGERRHEELVNVRGVPERVRQIPTEGRVFRHYAKEVSTINAIKASKTLIGGYLSYIEIAPGVHKKTYLDMTGVFLTLPGVEPTRNLMDISYEKYPYVDIVLPKDVPVLEVDKEFIYLIPLEANYHGWVKEKYARYKAGEPVDSQYKSMLEKIDARGGIKPTGAIPIEIVGEGFGQP